MDSLGNIEDYSAFFIACKKADFDMVAQAVIKENPTFFLVCSEISPQAHQDTSGHHVHVLATITDVQYRRIIHHLKAPLNLRGRATEGQSRSYGKVKLIRDILKMGAYTLKQQDPSGFLFSNFPETVIQQMVALSYEKEDIQDILPTIMKYISANFHGIEERNSIQPNLPYQCQQPDQIIKQAIIMFYKESKFSMKLPSRSKVNYYATHWALHESGWSPQEIVYYFYR